MAITRNIVSFDTMVSSLASIELLNETIKKKLEERYNYLLESIERYVPKDETRNIEVCLTGFHDTGGTQAIAEFAVIDRDKRIDMNSFNFHLQNTSQWLFAGGLVFDKDYHDFSVHT